MSDAATQPGLLARVWSLLRWPVALGVLGWLVHEHVYKNSGELLERSIAWWAVVGAVACFTVALFLTYFRWFLLVRAQDFEFTYGEAVRLGLVGMLFNFVAPGAIGGDIVKGSMIASRQRSRRLIAASTVVLDRCLGSLGLFFVGAVAFLFLPAAYQSAFSWLFALFVAGFAVGGGLIAIALWPRVTRSRWIVAMTEWRFVGRPLKGVLDAVGLYQAKWRVVLACILVSLVAHVCILSTFFLSSRAVARGSAVPGYCPQFVFGAGSNFVQAFVPTPGGTGVLESAIAQTFSMADGVKVSVIEESHGPDDAPPPEWQESTEVALDPKNADRLASIAKAANVSVEQLTTTLAGMSTEDAPRAFSTGVEPLPASAVWAVYRAGHTGIAFREGLLTGLAYRALTLLVAVIGAIVYFVSRREIDEAIRSNETADEPTSEPSPPRNVVRAV